MSGAAIDVPYSIASLPKPLDRDRGKIHTAPAYSLRGLRKRKRHEVIVGVDGESVNIYNIRSQGLVTSYALPPQTYLCCPPCSIQRKGTPSTGAQRQTYLVVKDGINSTKRRLLCFTQRARGKDKDAEFIAPTKSARDLSNGQVLSLDVVPGTSDDQFSVLVSYKGGAVEIVSGDLLKSHHEPASSLHGEAVYDVEKATTLDLETAIKGILKGREDIVAQLYAGNVLPASSQLLFRVVQTSEDRRLELFALRDPTQTALSTTRGALQLIMDHGLPPRRNHKDNPPRYELHVAAGTLYQLLGGQLNIFDLSGTVPKLAMKLGSKQVPISSFVPISSHTVLTFTKGHAMLHETTYGAVQASTALSTLSASASVGAKRTHTEAEEQLPSFYATCAFNDPSVVVGIFNHDLVALQLHNVVRGKTAQAGGILLRDVKGRPGMQSTRGLERDEKKIRKWEEWMARVDELVASEDFEGLERLVANDRQFGRQRKVENKDQAAHSGDIELVDLITYEDLWPLPEPFDPQDIEIRKALYLLSNVFGVSGEENDTLTIRIPSFKLLECLALSGTLSASYLRKVLSANLEISPATVKPGDIMIAISQVDDDLQLMHDLLSVPVDWEAAEIVQALRIVIQSFDPPNTQQRLLALPAPPQPNDDLRNGDVDMVSGDADFEIEQESKALENELDIVMNTLNTGLEVRSDTLQLITRRLSTFPQKLVTSLMRSIMQHSDIVFFIHILRIELADGGWTSKYTDASEEGLKVTVGGEEESKPNDEAIRAIGDLLNCAIDAIGTSGWLVGLSSPELGTDGLLESLKAEVAAGVEGCYQAISLKTLLMELEGRSALLTERREPGGMNSVDGHHELDGELPLLPLSSKSRALAQKERDSKRTKRAVAKENSRRIGEYSFERIRI